MFCINCGQKIEDGAKVCSHCGYSYEETEETVSQQDAYEPSESSQENVSYTERGISNNVNHYSQDSTERVYPTNPPKKNKNIVKILGIVAALLVIAVLGFAAYKILGSNLSSSSDEKAEYPGVYYLKDNELYFSKNDGKKQVKLEDDIYDKWSDSNDYSGYSYLKFELSEDGKKVFFLKEIDNSNYADLYYIDAQGKGDAVKVADDVETFRLIGSSKVLYKDDKQSLYISDLKNKSRISKNVAYFIVDKSQKYVAWCDNDGNLYYQQLDLKKDKEKLDKGVHRIDGVSNGLGTILYSKYDDEKYELYVIKNRGDKEKIVSNADDYFAYLDGDKYCVYYTKDKGQLAYTIMDFIEDDYPDDSTITEPDISAYTTYETQNGFWGPTQREIVDDKYYDELDKYKAKKTRDNLREFYSKRDLDIDEYAIYYLEEGSEEEKIESGYVEIIQDVPFKNEKVLLYGFVDLANIEKVKLSYIVENNDFENEFEKNSLEVLQVKMANGNDVATLEFGEEWFGDISVHYDGNNLYVVYFEMNNDGEENDFGTLYSVGTRGKELGVTEKIDTDVNEVTSVDGDSVYYFKEWDSEDRKGDLYCNGTKIDSEVSRGGYATDAGVVYYKDYDVDSSEGSLYLFNGGKPIKIADEVHSYHVFSEKCIAILTDYSTKNHMGDLEIFDGKDKKKIAGDVNAIVF